MAAGVSQTLRRFRAGSRAAALANGRAEPWWRMMDAEPSLHAEAMLELRPSCEHCSAALPPDSADARICSFECTFCASCVDGLLANVCPNCGGGFERRPVRPRAMLAKNPPRRDAVQKPVDLAAFAPLRDRMRDVAPGLR